MLLLNIIYFFLKISRKLLLIGVILYCIYNLKLNPDKIPNKSPNQIPIQILYSEREIDNTINNFIEINKYNLYLNRTIYFQTQIKIEINNLIMNEEPINFSMLEFPGYKECKKNLECFESLEYKMAFDFAKFLTGYYLNFVGIYYQMKNETKLARQYFVKAVNEYYNTNAMVNLGQFYFNTNRELALEYLYGSLNFPSYNETKGCALYLIGKHYHDIKEYNLMISFYIKAMLFNNIFAAYNMYEFYRFEFYNYEKSKYYYNLFITNYNGEYNLKRIFYIFDE